MERDLGHLWSSAWGAYQVSALHGRNVGDAGPRSWDCSHRTRGAATSDLPTIAILGRPNVGESTLLNRLAGEARFLVSPEPGTTRGRSTP